VFEYFFNFNLGLEEESSKETTPIDEEKNQVASETEEQEIKDAWDAEDEIKESWEEVVEEEKKVDPTKKHVAKEQVNTQLFSSTWWFNLFLFYFKV